MSRQATAKNDRASDVASPSSDYQRVFSELCHMVALSRTGKTTRVTEALVERTLVLDHPPPVDVAGVVASVKDRFAVTIPIADVTRAVEVLAQEGRLRRLGGRYQLDVRTKANVQRDIDAARNLETRVRDRWLEEIVAAHDDIDEAHRDRVWVCLRDYMAHVFQEHGALSAELLQAGGSGAITGDDNLVGHANRAIREAHLPVELCESVHASIHGFFNSDDADRNEYIAQHLDATFTIFALSTPDAAATYLRDQLRPLRLFLDTNFVFELLGLHVNPEDDVSQELVRFIRDNDLPITLHYHQRTLKEIRTTLSCIGDRLRSQRWSQSLSRAIVKTGKASGVEMKYHAQNAETPVSADVFMRRYEDHIQELLKGYGATMFRPKTGAASDEKHLLVEEYKAYVAARRPHLDEKRYETVEHDVTVLLSLRDERHPSTSALDSGALFLSNDRMLQRFDWDEFRGAGAPSVVMPQALLQVLRPFGQTSDDANRRFVRAFSLPEFRTAHADYGDTTVELRSYLATYDDLPEETAVAILGNELLHARLQTASDPAEFRTAVEDEVVRLNAELLEQREALMAESATKAGEIERLRERNDQLDTALFDAQGRVESLAGALDTTRAELGALTDGRDQLTAQVTELIADKKTRDAAEQAREAARKKRRDAAIATIWTLAALVAAGAVTWSRWLGDHSRRLPIVCLAVLVAGSFVWGRTSRRWGLPASLLFSSVVGIITLL